MAVSNSQALSVFLVLIATQKRRRSTNTMRELTKRQPCSSHKTSTKKSSELNGSTHHPSLEAVAPAQHTNLPTASLHQPPALRPAVLRPARTARTARSRRRSEPGEQYFEERKTIIEERPPPPPLTSYPPPPEFYEERKTVIEERESLSPSSHHASHHTRSPSNHGTIVLQEREYRSDRDIQSEIGRLEAERRALRLEREAEDRRNMAVRLRERPEEEFQMVEYRERGPTREVLEVVERDKSPPRNVLRVEKDRKGRMALVRSRD